MKKTPLQKVIDKLEILVRQTEVGSEEKRKLYSAISYLWDELEDERKTMSDIYDEGKKQDSDDVTGKVWVNNNFMDYQKYL